jgi:hypothetical protein
MNVSKRKVVSQVDENEVDMYQNCNEVDIDVRAER